MLTRARIQLIKSLSDKAARLESGLFVVEGRKMVGEALASGANVESVYLSADVSEDILPVQSRVAPERVTAKEMERISHLRTPSDVLAVVAMPPGHAGTALYHRGLTLGLDGVQDPGMLGTIIRIADWFGIGRVLWSPDSADCYNPKVVQATMGAIFRVTVWYEELEKVLADFAAQGGNIYGTFLEGNDMYGTELSQDGVIVMGSEGRGISPQVARMVNRKLFVPPFPAGRNGSESLNVAAATAVVCAEFRRRAR